MQFDIKSFAAGAVAVLVLGSGTAYAATGGKFILGQSNSANKVSTLSNSAGTALSLNSKAGTPPLKVNRAVKVANLNADKLDGLDSGAFARTAGQTGLVFTTTEGLVPFDMDLDGDVDYLGAIAVCPEGTIVTGGGGYTYGTSQIVDSWGNQDNGTYFWVALTDDLSATPDKFGANATCYNPRGALPSLRLSGRAADRHASMRAAMRDALAPR